MKIRDINTFQQYLNGVDERATDHANSVRSIVAALAGQVIIHKDQNTDLEVRSEGSEMKNVLWAVIRGTRYAFSYNHSTAEIELREGSVRGPVLHSFNDQTSVQAVYNIFSAL